MFVRNADRWTDRRTDILKNPTYSSNPFDRTTLYKNRQTDRHADRQTDGQMDIQTDGQREKGTDRQIDRRTIGQT